MFTGIIQSKGKIISTKKIDDILIIEVKALSSFIKNKKNGDSIAIDGACLSITDISKNSFKVEAIKETQNKTIINNYKTNSIVNLENPLKIGDSLDGHFVSGHIDYIGNIIEVKKIVKSKEITIKTPPQYQKHLSLKGSVTVNGVSLTISKTNAKSFTISLIPTTLENTNLDALMKNDKVNIEIDILSRYMESLLKK